MGGCLPWGGRGGRGEVELVRGGLREKGGGVPESIARGLNRARQVK